MLFHAELQLYKKSYMEMKLFVSIFICHYLQGELLGDGYFDMWLQK